MAAGHALVAGAIDVGITARDPERLVRFYGEHLGLPLTSHQVYPEAGAQLWFFAAGGGHLKILGYDRVPAAANPPGGNHSATGIRYVTMHVRRIDDVLAGLEAAGGSLQRHMGRIAFIADPEGNCIELVSDEAG